MNFKLNERNKDAISRCIRNDCILYSYCFKKQRLKNQNTESSLKRCLPKK